MWIKRLKAFHLKCQYHIASIRWQDHVRNTEVSSLTGLGPVLDPIVRHHSSLFGHVARLPEDTPSLSVPHRSVTQLPSRPELEAMSKPPSEQVA